MLLVQQTLLTATIETTYGVDPTPNPATDSLLVEDPDFTPSFSVLERNFVRTSFSQIPFQMGRKIGKMKIVHELRGNGIQNGGTLSDAPRIARLFQACSMALTAMSTAGTIWGPYPIRPSVAQQAVTAVGSSTSPTNTDTINYTIQVTTGGASGTAEVSITPDYTTLDTAQTAVTVTSGTAISVGSHGAKLTLTFTGNLTVGWAWQMAILPIGLRLDPITLNPQSITLHLYLNGILHVMTGCVGTYSIQADAGKFATVTFDFTGFYNAVTDVTFPTNYVFEDQLPAQVQLGKIVIDQGFQPIVNSFTLDIANTVSQRDDINAANGLIGFRISDRKPKGGIDPEAELVATEDFWGVMAAAYQIPGQILIGTGAGNNVRLLWPSSQFENMTYKSRDGIRANDISMMLSGVQGNDELTIILS